ncbi:GNAT family N-acetyltransferase [Kribbella deserti]|uniref:GNAT family N-acetyltransferase n=1 Tax=Kribbella deserti TaxID=1926257 RepID=A0ABV6QWR4_9ACTN
MTVEPRDPELDCVGALIQDARGRVFVQRRTAERRLLPGIWDIVGGHLEPGETPAQALAREIEEETGWVLRETVALIADWQWEYDGVVRRELDYLVTVDGDLTAPRLEVGKHDATAWVGPDDLELLMVGRTDGDRRLLDIVGRAVRCTVTDRLRLEPVTTGHAADLHAVQADPWVAEWYDGAWSYDEAKARAAWFEDQWRADGVSKWLAYRRTGELVGRGGLSCLAPDNPLVAAIASVLPASVAEVWRRDRLEVGWALTAQGRGHGYAAEIGRAGLDLAFGKVGAAAVVAFTEQHNQASRAVMARLGMRFAGEFTAEGLREGAAGVVPDAAFALCVIGPDVR